MLISIIIPVYNVEKYLRECVDSLLSQIIPLDKEIEIILIDDGSTDASGTICNEYKINYPEVIRVFHNDNQGLLMTRRFGFNHSDGEYILNCDSDDMSEPKQLEVLCNAIEKTSADVYLFNVNVFDCKTCMVWYENVFSYGNEVKLEKRAVIEEFLNGKGATSMCGKLFKRSCLDLKLDYSLYSSHGEDSIQSAEIYSNASTFVYINKALYKYRTGSGMTARFNPNYYSDYCKVFKGVESYEKLRIIDYYDEKMALRLFSALGRSITQTCLKPDLSGKALKEYFETIRNDDYLKEKKVHYPKIRKNLQKNYRLLIPLFLKRQYGLLALLLRIKGMIKRYNGYC